MKRKIIGVILSALAFYYVFPMFDGIHMKGGFVTAACLGALFAVISWAAAKLKGLAESLFIMGTLGLGCLIVIPLNVVFFWIMPALALKGLSLVVPAYFTISGWWPAFLGGLVLLFINVLTHTEPTVVVQSSGSVTTRRLPRGPRYR